MQSKARWTWLPLLLPAAAATTLLLAATRNGVGLSADSAHYIGAARELAAGHGLVVPWGTQPGSPPRALDLWPPLYPSVLAAIDRAGPDPVVSIRWLHATLLGVTVFVFGRIVLAATGNIWIALPCAALIACGGNLLRIHMMAWSEPLFLCLTVCGLSAVIVWCHRGGTLRLATAAAILGLAALTRYAGVGVAAGAGLALLCGWGTGRQRLGRFLGFGAVSAMPLFAWMSWQIYCGRGPTTRTLAWFPRLDSIVTDAAGAWSRLLLPDSVSGGAMALVVLSAAALTVAFFAADARRHLPFHEDVGSATLRHRARWVLGGAVAGYVAFYLASGLFFDPAIDFADVRHALTPFLLTAWLFVLSVYDLWEREGRRPMIAATALVGCLGLCVLMAPRAVDYSRRLAMGSGAGGQGYHDAAWRSSPTLAALRDLPADAPVFSNAPDAVYLLTGRPTVWLPRREAWRADGQSDWQARVAEVRDAVAHGARIVFLDRVAWRGASPDARDLERVLPVKAEVATDDGRIYAWSGDQEE